MIELYTAWEKIRDEISFKVPFMFCVEFQEKQSSTILKTLSHQNLLKCLEWLLTVSKSKNPSLYENTSQQLANTTEI